MPERIVVFWRDIPAQIIVQAGRRRAKRELAKRFIEAIDMTAMRVGARDTDAYLADWRKGDGEPCGDDLEAEADKAAAAVEAEYDDARLKSLVASGGYDERK
ncbi:MAG: virulence factor [Flavobacteriaceae bacterium]